MQRPQTAFFLYAPSASRADDWERRLRRHAHVVVIRDLAEFTAEDTPRWLGCIVDAHHDVDPRATREVSSTRAVVRMVRTLHEQQPDAPILVTSPSRLPMLPVAAQWYPSRMPTSEARFFVGKCLALEITRQPLVAEAVETLAREKGLTAKQMELTAVSTLDVPREDLIAGLGVSANTVKTRVRQLLRLHEAESMDQLGKHVLRLALDASSPARSRGGNWEVGVLPKERGAAPRSKPGAAAKLKTA